MGNRVLNVFFNTDHTEFHGPFRSAHQGLGRDGQEHHPFDMARIHIFDKQTEKAVR